MYTLIFRYHERLKTAAYLSRRISQSFYSLEIALSLSVHLST